LAVARRSPLKNVAAAADARLAAEGFRRQTHTWYRTNALGDHALIELQPVPSTQPGQTRFHVNTAIVVAPQVHRATESREKALPTTADGLLLSRVKPPGTDLPSMGWTASEPTAAATGALLAEALLAGPVERLRGLLDRDRLRAELSARGPENPALRAAFLAEEGPGPELDALVAELAADPYSAEYVAWLRRYAARG
jgi:hypothetical protein